MNQEWVWVYGRHVLGAVIIASLYLDTQRETWNMWILLPDLLCAGNQPIRCLLWSFEGFTQTKYHLVQESCTQGW